MKIGNFFSLIVDHGIWIVGLLYSHFRFDLIYAIQGFAIIVTSFFDDLGKDTLNKMNAIKNVNNRNVHFNASSAHLIVYERW